MSAKHPQTPVYISVGRLVQGSVSEVYTKDQQGNPAKHPYKFMSIAVPKTDPSVRELFQAMITTAWQGYQNVPAVAAEVSAAWNLFQANQFPFVSQRFRWKVEDGDAPDNASKEGMAGCWIIKLKTTLLDRPAVCDNNQNPIDPAAIKRGYYIDCAGSTSINGK